MRPLLLATLLMFASNHAVAGDDDENPLAKPGAKTPAKRPVKKQPAKKEPAKQEPTKKEPTKEAAQEDPAKKDPAKKAAKKAPGKKQPAKKEPVEETAKPAKEPTKKAAAKKAPAKKQPGKKAPEPEIEMEPDPPPPPPVVVVEAPPPKPEAVVVVRAKARSKDPYKKIYLRAGLAHVAPLESSRELELADVDGPASLAVQNGPIAGSGSSVSSATVPAIIIGYRLRPRLSLETVLGVPFTVKFKATGTLRDMSIAPTALGIPTGVPAMGEELGEAKAAPPTLTAVYDLSTGKVRPYVGAGVAVLFAFGAKVTNPLLTEVSQPDMKIAPAPGLVLQSGIETQITKRVYARLDVKFIALMLARARVEHIQVRSPELPLFDTVEVGTAKMSVWVNPLIIQLGVGTDF